MRYKEGIKLDNFLLYPFSCSLSALQTPGGCRPGGISEWRVCARIWTCILKHTPAQAHVVDYACMVDDTWSLCSVHNVLPPFVSLVTVLSSLLFSGMTHVQLTEILVVDIPAKFRLIYETMGSWFQTEVDTSRLLISCLRPLIFLSEITAVLSAVAI